MSLLWNQRIVICCYFVPSWACYSVRLLYKHAGIRHNNATCTRVLYLTTFLFSTRKFSWAFELHCPVHYLFREPTKDNTLMTARWHSSCCMRFRFTSFISCLIPLNSKYNRYINVTYHLNQIYPVFYMFQWYLSGEVKQQYHTLE